MANQAHPPRASLSLAAGRVLYFGPVAFLVALTALLAAEAMGGPSTWVDWALLALFAFNAVWLVLAAWQVVLGFALACLGPRGAGRLERRAAAFGPVPPRGRGRTAVLVPVHNEDPAAVFAAVEVIARSLAASAGPGAPGRRPDVDLFVLSDTRDPSIAAEEERRHARLLDRLRGLPDLPPLHYRRRSLNLGRKAGNIREFCLDRGRDHEFAVVLDADSLMSGDTIRRLVRLMEENPRLGVLQTVSYPANRETLFARTRQFAGRLYTHLSVKGLDLWQGPDGNYWGHNAIIRLRAFVEDAPLPVLPGRPPLGGEILCHDVVEGALMRRAGWELRVMPELGGSWEEMPTNMIDFAGRDRRWCQGNLQHLRFLPTPGLRWASRLHILIGIASYVCAPLWLACVGLWAARNLFFDTAGTGGGLGFVAPDTARVALPALVLALVFLPNVLGLTAALADPDARRGYGGAARLLAGALVDLVFAALLAPVLLLVHTRFVLTTLAGRVVGWDAQPRGDRAVTLGEALRHHAGHVLAGVVLAALALAVGPPFAWWTAPLFAGLLLSPFLTAWSSSVPLGRAAGRLGLFRTADETGPAPELLELRALLAEGEREREEEAETVAAPAAPRYGQRVPALPRAPAQAVGAE